MSSLRSFSLDSVALALQEEVPEADTAQIAERAEALVLIAEKHGVPVQPVLLQWIRYRTPGKQWSGEEWTRFCTKYAEDVKRLREQGATLDLERFTPSLCGHCGAMLHSEEQAQAHFALCPANLASRHLCPVCFAQELQLDTVRWFCAKCGDVTERVSTS